MDRKTIVEVSNQLITNRIIPQVGIDIVKEYCLEHGKPQDDTIRFIEVLKNMPLVLSSCLFDALDYYQKKFGVIRLNMPNGLAIKYY